MFKVPVFTVNIGLFTIHLVIRGDIDFLENYPDNGLYEISTFAVMVRIDVFNDCFSSGEFQL